MHARCMTGIMGVLTVTLWTEFPPQKGSVANGMCAYVRTTDSGPSVQSLRFRGRRLSHNNSITVKFSVIEEGYQVGGKDINENDKHLLLFIDKVLYL